MSIKQEWAHFKTIWGQGSDLILLRLRMLRLDANEQLAVIIKIFSAVVVMAILSLIGLMAMLLGLNVVLPDIWKIRVFFSVAALTLLICFGLMLWIPIIWKHSSGQISETLGALQNDIRALRGEKPLNISKD